MNQFFKFLIGANLIYSIYLVIFKMFFSCNTCGYLPVNLPVNQVQLAFIALMASLGVALLYKFYQRSKTQKYFFLVFLGINAIASSCLMSIQLRAQFNGYNLCWQCLVSEIMFYLIFMTAVLQNITPWVQQKISKTQ